MLRFHFGKYRDLRIDEVDPGYLNCCLSMATKDPYGFVGSWAEENRETIEEVIRDATRQKMLLNIPEYTLSPSQAEAVAAIDLNLIMGDAPVMRLQGGAGYGKSFATMDVVRRAIENGLTVNACATSYVATEVLREQLDPLGVNCGTIARMIRLEPKLDGPNETYIQSEETIPSVYDLLQPGKLLIVDEYSMVSDEIARLFLDTAISNNGKLLVVGDAHQLPCPGQNWNSMLDKVEPSAELTVPMRYSQESTLYQVERQARSNPFQFEAESFVNGDGEVHRYSDWDGFLKAFVEVYKANPTFDIRMLWYRRQHMVDANHAIRKALYGDSPLAVEEGEQIRIQRTTDYGVPYASSEQKNRYYSGRHYRVLESRETVTEVMGFQIPVTQVVLDNHRSVNLLFSVTEGKADPKTRGGQEFNAALAEIAEQCSNQDRPWSDYKEFRNAFLQVAYSYATTVHRTQGMSADIIFTSPPALKQAKPFDAQRLLYVGLTRAKKQLHCLG